MSNEKAKPVHEIRFGRIKAVIWPVEGQHGRFYSVTIARIYRDAATWKESTSFSRDDLPLVGKVADQAHSWIFTQGQNASGGHDNEAVTSGNDSF
jgi:hypothetical protein